MVSMGPRLIFQRQDSSNSCHVGLHYSMKCIASLKTLISECVHLEAWTPSRLRAAVVGGPLSRLRQTLGDPAVLGGQEREGQELDVIPEPGLPV